MSLILIAESAQRVSHKLRHLGNTGLQRLASVSGHQPFDFIEAYGHSMGLATLRVQSHPLAAVLRIYVLDLHAERGGDVRES